MGVVLHTSGVPALRKTEAGKWLEPEFKTSLANVARSCLIKRNCGSVDQSYDSALADKELRPRRPWYPVKRGKEPDC